MHILLRNDTDKFLTSLLKLYIPTFVACIFLLACHFSMKEVCWSFSVHIIYCVVTEKDWILILMIVKKKLYFTWTCAGIAHVFRSQNRTIQFMPLGIFLCLWYDAGTIIYAIILHLVCNNSFKKPKLSFPDVFG